MPQVFQVLRCFKCFVFQVHQTKKSNKWQCKLCGEKQSIKRHYGLGNGKECRLHVQKLNKIRGLKVEADNNLPDANSYEYDEDDDKESEVDVNEAINDRKPPTARNSKWETFVDTSQELKEIIEPIFFDNKEVVLEIPQKRKCIVAKLNKAKLLNNTKCLEEIDTFKANNVLINNMNKPNRYFNNDLGQKMKNQQTESTKWGSYLDGNEKQSDSDLYCDSFEYGDKEFIQKHNLLKCVPSKANRECNEIQEGKLNTCIKNEVDNDVIQIENVKNTVDIKPMTQSYVKTKETITNSMWDKYLEDNENSPVSFRTDKVIENVQSMFSLCDDDNIDDVLDF